jgi:hypothetical protein
MVDGDKLVTSALTALTIKKGLRLQFGPESATAIQVNALAIWEDVDPRAVVMLAVEKLYEKMVREIQEYYDDKLDNT